MITDDEERDLVRIIEQIQESYRKTVEPYTKRLSELRAIRPEKIIILITGSDTDRRKITARFSEMAPPDIQVVWGELVLDSVIPYPPEHTTVREGKPYLKFTGKSPWNRRKKR